MKRVNHVPGCTDPDVEAWVLRVIAAGSTVSRRTKDAHCAFVTAGKLDGWWSAIDRLNTFAGNTFAALFIPLKPGIYASGPADTNISTTIIPAMWSESTGLDSQGVGLLGVDFPTTPGFLDGSMSMAVYSLDWPVQSALQCGYYDPSVSCFLGSANTGHIIGAAWASAGQITSASSDQTGAIQIIRNGTAISLYQNGVQTATAPDGGGAIFGNRVDMFFASGASPFGPCDMTLGGYALGRAMSPSQIVDFHAAWAALSLALGRPL